MSSPDVFSKPAARQKVAQFLHGSFIGWSYPEATVYTEMYPNAESKDAIRAITFAAVRLAQLDNCGKVESFEDYPAVWRKARGE